MARYVTATQKRLRCLYKCANNNGAREDTQQLHSSIQSMTHMGEYTRTIIFISARFMSNDLNTEIAVL